MGHTSCFKADAICTSDKKYCMSTGALNHYDAKQFCEAIGKRLVRLSDVDESGSSCTYYAVSTASSQVVVNALQADSNWSLFENHYIWTENVCGNSCGGYYVRLSDGDISTSSRNLDNGHYALCE